MNGKESRREFLQSVSLAGAALVAGGGALAAGCAKSRNEQASEETCADGHKKVCAWIDENGCLYIDDADLTTALNNKYKDLVDAGKPSSGDRLGICVRWKDPGSGENKMNSLCNC